MGSRAEQKARTRNALVSSVLRIVGDGANFASISLREVARTAGVVPTAFYRHFGNMNELGLAVVDQLGLDLRRMMRGTWDPDRSDEEIVAGVVEAFQRYVLDNADLMRFVDQARTGSADDLRQAIDAEAEAVAARIASALRDLVPGLKPGDREIASHMVVSLLMESGGKLLAIPRRDDAARQELIDTVHRSLLLLLAGTRALATPRAPRQPRRTGSAASPTAKERASRPAASTRRRA